MSDSPIRPFRSVHMALADPLRLQLFEQLLAAPASARELAARVELPPDRLYYHLRQLEQAGLVEVAEYRPLSGGKVERIYRVVEVEPPGDDNGPEETARFLATVLDATQADIAAAFAAKSHGRTRQVTVGRTTIRLSLRQFDELRHRLEDLIHELDEAEDEDDDHPVRVLFTLVDLTDRD
jgi:DNA-binding transcriptional ArsR family regulator